MDPASPKPHGETAKGVRCDECHEEEAALYAKHGRLKVGSDPDLPACADCHGTHDIFPSSDKRSQPHPLHVPRTCRTCHIDVDLVKRHFGLHEGPIALYESSVHGQATGKEVYMAATCNHCHSADGPDGRPTAHRILAAADPESTINHFVIPDTCAKCHQAKTKDFWEGIHGKLVAHGSVDAPVCTTCHGEHGHLAR